MAYLAFKVVVTAALIVMVSEFAKRNSFAGALLASVPLVSVLAILWLYVETKDAGRVASLSSSIFWLVLPSLLLFWVLPLLLKHGINFYWSMAISIGVTVACYGSIITTLKYMGIKL